MVELLQDKDIVITSNEIRNQILKELTNKKIMLNLKFYTLNEFADVGWRKLLYIILLNDI